MKLDRKSLETKNQINYNQIFLSLKKPKDMVPVKQTHNYAWQVELFQFVSISFVKNTIDTLVHPKKISTVLYNFGRGVSSWEIDVHLTLLAPTGDEIYLQKIYIHILDSFYLVLISTFNKSLFVSVSCYFYRICIHAFLVKMNIIMHQFIQQVTSANDPSDYFTVPSCPSTEDVKRYQERTIWSAALL